MRHEEVYQLQYRSIEIQIDRPHDGRERSERSAKTKWIVTMLPAGYAEKG